MKLFEIKKKKPSWLLVESKNTHLEHLEDLIFNKGYQGAEEAVDYLESIRKMLATGTGSKTSVTVKWDGSPAIFCGTDPQDGKFFVGTKAVFSKESKACKTTKDIEKFYGDKPKLANKLAQALKYLSKLEIQGVLQGDLMFTQDSLESADIDGKKHVTFTPNTITYAVPEDSEIGKRIKQAQIGIIFHTTYEGESLDQMSAEFGANVKALKQNSNVWFDDATYKDLTGRASLTPQEDSQITRELFSIVTTMKKLGKDRFDKVLIDTEFRNSVKPFVNQQIRSGKQIDNPTAFLKDFITYYSDIQLKAIDALKSGPESRAAQLRLGRIKKQEQWMENNANALLGILAVYKRLILLKNRVIGKLNNIDNIGTFQKTDGGYRVTNPEGFVAIGHEAGAVKLVDRLEFSRTNFMKKA